MTLAYADRRGGAWLNARPQATYSSSIAASISADPQRGAREYAQAHIPGAVYADLDHDLVGLVEARSRPPSVARCGCIFRRAWTLGLDAATSPVVAYDDASGAHARRACGGCCA